MIGCWIGFGVVCFLLLLGWLRRNREGLPFGGGERVGNALVVILGIALPIVAALGALLLVGHRRHPLDGGADARSRRG